MILKTCADNLSLVAQIFRANESDNAVHKKRFKRARNSVRPSFQRQLINSVMRLRRERATLAGLEVHRVLTDPVDIALAMMLDHPFASVVQHVQVDSEASVCRFRSRNGLKKKINRRPAVQCR